MDVKKMFLQLLIFNLLYEAYHAASDSGNSSPSGREVVKKETADESIAPISEIETSKRNETAHQAVRQDEIIERLQKLTLEEEKLKSDSENVERKTVTKSLDRDVSTSGRKVTNFDQVGGHHGIKRDIDGFLLKPSLELEELELEFYETVARSESATLRELKPFLSEFDGTKMIDGVKHIRLRNIIENFVSPCIMDIKMGYQIWDPMSIERKINKRKVTYLEMRNRFHFCIQGFEYDDLLADVFQTETTKSTKADLKLLKPEGGIETLYGFVNGELGLKAGLVDQIVEQLKDISAWFERQREYKFYASSIFLSYDSNDLVAYRMAELANKKAVANVIEKDSKNLKAARKNLKVRVRMIDFNHARKSTEKDENYLKGLERLIRVFENLDALHKDPQLLEVLFPIEETNVEPS